jgi:hypothetical protein
MNPKNTPTGLSATALRAHERAMVEQLLAETKPSYEALRDEWLSDSEDKRHG